MPTAPKRPCSFPGCHEMVSAGRCPVHSKRQDQRGGATERGYNYLWQKFREWFIWRHPICVDCQIKATTDVHHVKKVRNFPELMRVEANCMGLCGPCHSTRTLIPSLKREPDPGAAEPDEAGAPPRLITLFQYSHRQAPRAFRSPGP